MRRLLLLLVPILLLSSFPFPLPASVYAAPPGNSSDWVQTFSDEFNGPTLDRSKWDLRYYWGEEQINGELQAYVDDAFVINNGILRIRADQRQGTYGGQIFDYTSGLIATDRKYVQRYGYFEARLKMPKGQGFWPAFWLADTYAGRVDEIDIQEFINDDSYQRYYQTLHWGTNYDTDYHRTPGMSYTATQDLTADFHLYAVLWNATGVYWYFDGNQIKSTTAFSPAIPLAIRANLAVGGNWPGFPDSTTPFPAYYDIDYVRVYQARSLAYDLDSNYVIDYRDFVLFLPRFNSLGNFNLFDYNSLIRFFGTSL